ncbi:hypothetical protein QVD17_08232 [Tagetes erecta]|uniref:PGG domain-containing protein n=1 Tax=Tagetes erecta TaxID=13708 RepID=A0AAD8P4I8_TARER|nr:hypothetical protein QVD17_08232 [Tagetes erecta]
MKRRNRNRNNENQRRKETGCASITDNYLQSSGAPQYPYQLSHLNVANFVSIELSGIDNYVPWKEQMMCLLENHDMLGFIDGTLKKPRKNKYKEWKRSDTLAKGWIFGSLSEDVMQTVVGLETAYDVWNKLKIEYTLLPSPISTTPKEKDVDEYLELYRAILSGDWDSAQEFFMKDEDALIVKINEFGCKAIHLAVDNAENINFFEKLLDLIKPESIPTLLDDEGMNALHHAAIRDNVKAAEKLVQKNPHLLFIVDNEDILPIQKAIFNSHNNTFQYLLGACKKHITLSEKEGYDNPFVGQKGVSILGDSILSGLLDVAYDLLQEYPELATTYVAENQPALWCIANVGDAYPSSKQYNFFQRFIYSHVPMKDYGLDVMYKIPDIENLGSRHNASHVTKLIKRIYFKFWKVAVLYVPHIKHLQTDKAKHNTAIKILKFICAKVSKLKSGQTLHYEDAFLVAVCNNTLEVIEHISKTFPKSIWSTNMNDHSLSQLSIIKRSENVYNFFVHNVTHDKHLHNVLVDKERNNLLHLAGKLAPTDKLNMVSGAALQMQRELQWFQEVSKLIHPRDRNLTNKHKETPSMVFRREHENLRQKGEEWMKKTADSYTITAALIITIAFAAAITIPGGNNEDTGKATFENRPSFIIFVVSDAISMFTSTTSLLWFLSILTARYAEEDFLYKLPKRLIIGLVMLFMSVTTMLIAFSAALYILFELEDSWILIPVASITCLPIASFVTLQLPLLIDLFSSTYGRGIFGKYVSLDDHRLNNYLPPF